MIHYGAKAVSSEDMKHVAGAVLYGDPMNGDSIPGISNLKVFCYKNDPLCWNAGKLSASHYALVLTHFAYGEYHDAAATYVAGLPLVKEAIKQGSAGKGIKKSKTFGMTNKETDAISKDKQSGRIPDPKAKAGSSASSSPTAKTARKRSVILQRKRAIAQAVERLRRRDYITKHLPRRSYDLYERSF